MGRRYRDLRSGDGDRQPGGGFTVGGTRQLRMREAEDVGVRDRHEVKKENGKENLELVGVEGRVVGVREMEMKG